MSIMGDLFGNITDRSADETIAVNSMGGIASSALAYLMATLEATTPEVRRLFSEYTTQSLLGHEAITAYVIKKGWVKPYSDPVDQLQTTLESSRSIISEAH